MNSQYFHRPELAEQLARQILTVEVGSAATSGVFLAAPRRTGKSTFLREDLRPTLERTGAYVLYVDLWADRRSDPGEVIVHAVRSAISQFDSVLTKLARRVGLQSVGAAGLTFSLEQVGLGARVSMSDALSALSDELKKPIVLIIDEAQQAIVTDSGYDALFALKAARDELNSSAHFGLRIVATGSNRDKLSMLRNSKDQAFFGAPLIEFPSLDQNYIAWFCQKVKVGGSLDPTMVWQLFERASHRPEILGASADQLRFDFALAPEDVQDRFTLEVENQIAASEQQALQVINSLTPLQSCVLRVLAARPSSFVPFDSQTMDAYAHVLSAIAPKEKIKPDASNVQQALTALQEKLLVWREKRGVYALEEAATAQLMRAHGMLDSVPALN
jgi:hypothetical protein